MTGDPLVLARAHVASARAIVVLTGAGVSAESGIPTFRGPGGLWRTHRPETLATPEAFARDPKLVWEWYDWRRGIVAGASPNPAHRALVELEQRTPQFTLVTQNVDGLHQAAGSQNLIALHGDLWTLRCTLCGAERVDRTAPLADLPPRCACGGLERPGVVWFGERLPPGAIERAADAVLAAELVIVAGTSGVVYPAAGLTEIARDAGTPVVVVDPAADPSQEHAIVLRGPAGAMLPALVS